MSATGVSIALPFLFGVLAATVAFGRLAPSGISHTAFALSISVSMSVTALPVLVRVLQDLGLFRREVGVVALSCADGRFRPVRAEVAAAGPGPAQERRAAEGSTRVAGRAVAAGSCGGRPRSRPRRASVAACCPHTETRHVASGPGALERRPTKGLRP